MRPRRLAEPGHLCTSAVMGVVFFLTHGRSLRTTTAYLGTVAGLAVTAVLAHAAIAADHLSGITDDKANTVSQLIGSADLRNVVLAGTLIAALGLLNDVIITQASAVWEIRSADPSIGFAELFRSGMRIGRDHLASTVYTVVFAYAGTALPTLLLVRLSGTPTAQILNGSLVGQAIISACVGGISLALTVPLTTALAAAVTAGATSGRETDEAGPGTFSDRSTDVPSGPVRPSLVRG